MKASFERYIGIDYSGRGAPTAGTAAIQVFAGSPRCEPVPIAPLSRRSWNRAALADWLVDQLGTSDRAVVGIDHAFSFPMSYMERYELQHWDDFLVDFRHHLPTHRESVESLRTGNPRSGDPSEFRLTDRWTSSAKSVFLFDINGSVAKSTHAGLPWLLKIREHAQSKVFFWPFDGWAPPVDGHVIAEVYPSIFRNRYRRGGLKGDALDAFGVAMWLRDMDLRGALNQYFNPPLTQRERATAQLEGWILGVS